MGDFELDTRVRGADGRYRAQLSREWEIWGPNGGYTAAIALRAAGREAAIQRPASFACHFLSVPHFEAVDIEVAVLQRGRRAESMHVVMRQGGRPVLQGILRTAVQGPGLEHSFCRMPEVRYPHELPSFEEIFPDQEPTYVFWKNIEGKPVDPEVVAEGPRPREPHLVGWHRFRPRATFDDVWVDAGRMLLLLDTMSWPAACMPHWPREYQAPNLCVTAWFHDFAPDSDWLLADHDSPLALHGLVGVNGRIWSADGRLLAAGGAQLLCVPAPPQEK